MEEWVRRKNGRLKTEKEKGSERTVSMGFLRELECGRVA